MTETAIASGMLDEIQAWAAVAAILAGFGYVIFERWTESAAAGRAAGHLARHSIDFATDRLEALVDPSQPIDFALRRARATEMIEVFRELEISKVPPRMIEAVAIIRSAVYAVNSRIDEVLRDDGARRAERRSRLYSAGRTLTQARRELDALKRAYVPWKRKQFATAPLAEKMRIFLDEAKAPSASP